MSLMETYLIVTCPVKGCSLHVETPVVDAQLTNPPSGNLQTLTDGRSPESGIDNVNKQLDFWHSKTDRQW